MRHWNAADDAAVVVALVALAALAILSCGCANEHLAYDAKARTVICEQIAAKAKMVKCELVSVEEEIPPVTRDAAMARLGEMEKLAQDGIRRGQIAQVYYGTPPELEVTLGNGRDDYELLANAALAIQTHKRRGWFGRKLEEMAAGIAKIVAGVCMVMVKEVSVAVMPVWAWVAIGIGALVAIVAGVLLYLYRLYRKAIYEYDETVEELIHDKPADQRRKIGHGRPHMQRAHVGPNEERRRRYDRLVAAYFPGMDDQRKADLRLAAIGDRARHDSERKERPGEKTSVDVDG